MELGNGVVLIVWVNLGRGVAWKWGGAYSVGEFREGMELGKEVELIVWVNLGRGWSLERG